MSSLSGKCLSLASVGMLLTFGLCPSARALVPGFHPLGHLPGDFSSQGFAVSSDGSVAVGLSYLGGSRVEAFRWTESEGMVGLGGLDGADSGSGADGVSADGSVVVGTGEPSYQAFEAFRWTAADGMVGLGDLPGGTDESDALAVSADGTVVVGVSDAAQGYEAFRWSAAEGMVALGELPGGTYISEAYGVSGDGSVVVGYSRAASGNEAFRWTAETGMVGLGYLPGGMTSGAYAVSADGSTIVGVSRSEAFRWSAEGGMVGLGDLPGGNSYSAARDVSANGSIIAGNSNSDRGGDVFVWDQAHGMRNLREMLDIDLTGWAWIDARGISDDGSTIIGIGYHPDNDTNEAWIAVLAPWAKLIGASSWQTHGAGVGREGLQINASGQAGLGNVTSEPRSGGIAELRLAFDRAPGPPGSSPVTLEERTCGDGGDYVPYTGATTSSASVEDNELVLIFTPPLENARTYRITIGHEVSSIYNQSVQVRVLAGDIDSSGYVNAVDRSMAVGAWTGPTGYSAATDLDLTGRTDAVDRSMVVAAWTGPENCAP